MKMNKWAAVTLAMTLVCSTIPTVAMAATEKATATVTSQAGEKTQAQLAEMAQKQFAIPESYKLESASRTDSDPSTGSAVWMLSWRSEEIANKTNVNVVLDAKTGEVFSYTSYGPLDPGQTEKIAEADARARAVAWVKKLAPDKSQLVDKMQIQADNTSNSLLRGPLPGEGEQDFSYRFQREINGVPVAFDEFSVTIDTQGTLRSYRSNPQLDLTNIPAETAAVDAAQAKAIFSGQLPLQRYYQTRSVPGMKMPEMHIAYGTRTSLYDGRGDLPYVDAQSGKLIQANGDAYEPFTLPAPIADQPGAAPAAQELDKEAAIKIAKSYLKQLDDSYELQNSEFNTNETSKAWNLTWSKKLEKGEVINVRATINAQNGELSSAYSYKGDYRISTEETKGLPWTDLRDKAIAFVKQAVPTQQDSLVLLTQETKADKMYTGGTPSSHFEFVKLINGVPDYDLRVRVTLEQETGNLVEFHANLVRTVGMRNEVIQYPDPKTSIAVDAARTAFTEKFPLQLQYIPIWQSPESGKGQQELQALKLVYLPTNIDANQHLDAQTGKWFAASGSQPDKKQVKDIAGHWAEKQLQYMADYGIYPVSKEGQIHPQQEVTRGDVMRILVLTMANDRFSKTTASNAYGMKDEKSSPSYYNDVDPNDPNFPYIETAIEMGWLPRDVKDFRPEEKIDRKNLAEVVVRVLGYQKLAEKQNVFLKPFQDLGDADAKYIGAISIAKAFGLMNGNVVNFGPSQNVTRAELSIVLTRLQDEKGVQYLPF